MRIGSVRVELIYSWLRNKSQPQDGWINALVVAQYVKLAASSGALQPDRVRVIFIIGQAIFAPKFYLHPRCTGAEAVRPNSWPLSARCRRWLAARCMGEEPPTTSCLDHPPSRKIVPKCDLPHIPSRLPSHTFSCQRLAALLCNSMLEPTKKLGNKGLLVVHSWLESCICGEDIVSQHKHMVRVCLPSRDIHGSCWRNFAG
jgi:hypothetical protein